VSVDGRGHGAVHAQCGPDGIVVGRARRQDEDRPDNVGPGVQCNVRAHGGVPRRPRIAGGWDEAQPGLGKRRRCPAPQPVGIATIAPNSPPAFGRSGTSAIRQDRETATGRTAATAVTAPVTRLG